MTGVTNQIQTPLGSGVQAALELTAGAASGISTLPVNPGISYTGTLYGSLFTVWQSASTSGGAYTTPLTLATYDNAAANGAGNSLPSITTLNLGTIQQLNNAFTGTIPTLTSFVGNSLLQFSSDFSPTMAALTTLTLPNLVYVGGSLSATLATLTSFSLPALTSINGAFSPTLALATSVSMPLLVFCGGLFSPTINSCTTLTLTKLAYIGVSFGISSTSLTTLSLPALVSVGTFFQIVAANMTTFSMGSTLLSIGSNFTMTGMKLNQASVDGILVSLSLLNGTGGTTAYSNLTINLSGGTSSTPSSTGLAAKTILTGRGCTVTTN